MKAYYLIALCLMLSACADLQITRHETTKAKDGTHYTRYHVQYDVAPACVGTCTP